MHNKGLRIAAFLFELAKLRVLDVSALQALCFLMALALLIHLESGAWPFLTYCTATRTNPVMPHALEMKHCIPEMHLCLKT